MGWRVSIFLVLCACGVDSGASISEGMLVEENESADVAQQDVTADVLNVKVMEGDVAPGTLSARTTKIFTSMESARSLLGGGAPSVDYSRNWLIAYRPDAKSPRARVTVTRAQLSASGQTLSLWATVTEPAAGCASWQPNEVSLARVPKRAVLPTTVRVYLSRATTTCGLVTGPACTPGMTTCPAATPLCLGAFELSDGSFTSGTCAKLEKYDHSSEACASDADCSGGICAGLSFGSGLCQPAWMRGTWSMPESGQLSVPLPQGGAWHRVVVRVMGQASVPMDAWVSLFVDGVPASRVEWRLANGYGTTSSLMRVGQFGVPVPVGVPGDEQVNADWVLEVRDLGRGAPGVFRGARLSFTSRWD